MPVNSDKTLLWKQDVAQSVDLYNDWFINFAPLTYREARKRATIEVETALLLTNNLNNLTADVIKINPPIVSMLRMATAPPIARERLAGLARVPNALILSMEVKQRVPPKMSSTVLDTELGKVSETIKKLIDKDIFPWLGNKGEPSETEIYRAATIVADRFCGSLSDPIIRNAQEQRQLEKIKNWLEARGYKYTPTVRGITFDKMHSGSFTFRFNIPVFQQNGVNQINIPVDVVVKRKSSNTTDLPILIEAKSAGDFTNTNKRRKEEAIKVEQLRRTYGGNIEFILFLCGYFDTPYLGYEAAEGIDWIWEHRIDDFAKLGL